MKRLTDTMIWNKEWYQDMDPQEKLLWRYLCDSCDMAGVWDSNWKLASFQLGFVVTETDMGALGDRVQVMANGDILVVDFIEFQYGNLGESSSVHKGVRKCLESHDLSYPFISLNKALPNPSVRTKDKVKVKAKAKAKVKDKDKGEPKPVIPEIPTSLDTPEFRTTWADWVQHRLEKKKPLKPTTIKKQFCELEKMGVTRAIAAIDYSILRSWEGIFEDKSPPSPQGSYQQPEAPEDREPREPKKTPEEIARDIELREIQKRNKELDEAFYNLHGKNRREETKSGRCAKDWSLENDNYPIEEEA